MIQDIVEALPLPTVLVAASGRIQHSNAGARALFGQAIEGRHYITVLRQPPLLDAVDRCLAGNVKTQADYLTTEARRDITMQATCAPLPENAVLISFEDRTAIQDISQMRRDFVANVSHELRTPLTALMGFIETLRNTARDDPGARDRFLGIMELEASRMNRLVADLLSLSRVEADERVRPTTPVNLGAVVTSVLGSLAPMIDANSTTIDMTIPDTDPTVPGDADQLGQVATNLIENAIKYSGQNGRVEISVQSQSNHAHLRRDAVVLTVRDHGEGIDPIHIPRLTERFYRIDSHRSREMGGTGLGLAIVKHIVNRHRGRLKIESELGKGSVFSVILPAEISGA